MIDINYVTSSTFKTEENQAYANVATLEDGRSVATVARFEIVKLSVKEILEVDLAVMVSAEVLQAYSQLKIPCIVEHAGLILERHLTSGYPGGLTKPMWDTLGPDFLDETGWTGQPARARAVIAYCDGRSVKTYVGETVGRLADRPRGDRRFYWDTVFIPDEVDGAANDKTYAEIVEAAGLEAKMRKLSQSARAMTAFITDALQNPPDLWR